MSLISKDKIIGDCADALRLKLGSEDGIKAGLLAQTIGALSASTLAQSGEITTTTTATSLARAVKINLKSMPDILLFYRTDTGDETNRPASTMGAICVKSDEVVHLLPITDASDTNINCVFLRSEGSAVCQGDFTAAVAMVKGSSTGALARITGSANYPLYPGVYKYSAYKL